MEQKRKQLIIMKTTAPLYLASQSPMRKQLLEQAKIPFTVISQSADEAACNWDLPPKEVVLDIARSKMAHAVIPSGKKECFVLTADTLCVDSNGMLHGKPADKEEALAMLKKWRAGCTVITGFCLDKKTYQEGQWYTQERKEEAMVTTIEFCIPDAWLAEYLAQTPAMNVAGAMSIEDYGFQFVRFIQGSYTNIIGLPLYQVREALSQMGFFINEKQSF